MLWLLLCARAAEGSSASAQAELGSAAEVTALLELVRGRDAELAALEQAARSRDAEVAALRAELAARAGPRRGPSGLAGRDATRGGLSAAAPAGGAAPRPDPPAAEPFAEALVAERPPITGALLDPPRAEPPVAPAAEPLVERARPRGGPLGAAEARSRLPPGLALTARRLSDCADLSDGQTDSANKGCAFYRTRPQRCGNFDDGDFAAQELCCGCGGGDRAEGTGEG